MSIRVLSTIPSFRSQRFNSRNSLNPARALSPTSSVEYLVVAGGAGGGQADNGQGGGGGGGAGGYRTATSFAVSVGSALSVIIGAG